MLFRSPGLERSASYGEWTIDADAVAITQQQDRLVLLAAQRLARLTQGTRLLASATSAVSLLAGYETPATTVTVTAPRATTLRVWSPRKPAHIEVDDRPLSSITFDVTTQTIAVDLPAGDHCVRIENASAPASRGAR